MQRTTEKKGNFKFLLEVAMLLPINSIHIKEILENNELKKTQQNDLRTVFSDMLKGKTNH